MWPAFAFDLNDLSTQKIRQSRKCFIHMKRWSHLSLMGRMLCLLFFISVEFTFRIMLYKKVIIMIIFLFFQGWTNPSDRNEYKS